MVVIVRLRRLVDTEIDGPFLVLNLHMSFSVFPAFFLQTPLVSVITDRAAAISLLMVYQALIQDAAAIFV